MLLLALIILAVLIYLYYKSRPGSGAKLPPLSRDQIADKLEDFAAEPEYKPEKATYLSIAQALRSGTKPKPTAAGGVKTKPAAAATRTTVKQQPSKPSVSPFHLLENINILLFLGAFLVVSSVLILVAGNYELIADNIKMLLVLIGTFLFFGVGIMLYLSKPKLRPAGLTFTLIGMIMVPLNGVAFYNFVSPASDPLFVWVVTSIISLAIYRLTAVFLRQTYIFYAVILALVSVLQSIAAYGGLSPAMNGLILAVTGLIFINFTLQHQDSPFEHPMFISAHVLVPVGALISFSSQSGVNPAWGIGGVTLLLAGVAYLQTGMITKELNSRQLLFTISYLLFPLSFVSLLRSAGLGTDYIGAAFAAAGGAYVLAARYLEDKYRLHRDTILTIVHLLAIVAVLSGWQTGSSGPAIILAVALIYAVGYHLFPRRTDLLGGTVVTLLLLPQSMTFKWLDFEGDWLAYAMSANYAVLAGVFMYTRQNIKELLRSGVRETDVKPWLQAGYGLSLAAVWISSLFVFGWFSFAVAALVALAFNWASNVEQAPQLVLLVSIALFSSVASLTHELNLNSPLFTSLLVLGPLLYVIGLNGSMEAERSRWWRWTGLTAVFLGLGHPFIPVSITSLLIGGTLLYIESILLRDENVTYLSGAVILFAAQWWFQYSGSEELLVYALPWGVYLLFIARHKYLKGRFNTSQLLTVLGLSALTIPLALQVQETQSVTRALILLLISVGIILVGVAWHYRLVIYWGIAFTVIGTIYQFQDVIAAIPKQFISLFIGILLLLVSVYLLQKRRD